MKNLLPLLTLIFVIYHGGLEARDLKASLASLPIHSEVDENGKKTGGFVRLVKAINDVYLEGDISIGIYPFARSLKNVVSGQADFHVPLINLLNQSAESLPYAYASEPLTQVAFVLYARSNAPLLDRVNLEDGQYRIDILRGSKAFFTFNTGEVNKHVQGIRKILNGRIDGFIAEQESTDKYLRENRISGIRRSLYAYWDVHIVIPKGEKKIEIDKIISGSLRKLRKSGRLKKINATIHQPYNNWQPYQMTW